MCYFYKIIHHVTWFLIHFSNLYEVSLKPTVCYEAQDADTVLPSQQPQESSPESLRWWCSISGYRCLFLPRQLATHSWYVASGEQWDNFWVLAVIAPLQCLLSSYLYCRLTPRSHLRLTDGILFQMRFPFLLKCCSLRTEALQHKLDTRAHSLCCHKIKCQGYA